jgi:hypothetical protein
MFPNNVQFLGRERDKERYQEAEYIRLVKIAQGDGFNGKVMLRTVVAQVGAQMVKWGIKLQGVTSKSWPAVASINDPNV